MALLTTLRRYLRRPRAETYRYDRDVGPYMAGEEGTAPEPGLMGRIVRYIPGEVVGMYVTVGGIIEGVIGKQSQAFGLTILGWYWVGFWFFLLTSPGWMWLTTAREGKPTQWFQVLVTPFAFAVWAIALGGPFRIWLGDATAGPDGQYSPAIASVLLFLVTAGIGGLDQALDALARPKAQGPPEG